MCCKGKLYLRRDKLPYLSGGEQAAHAGRLMRQASRAFNLNEHESESFIYVAKPTGAENRYHSLDL